MPISIGGPLPPPAALSPTRRFDYTYVEWFTERHGALPLTHAVGAPQFLAEGVAGLGSVPLTFTTSPLPAGGSRIKNSRPESRIITLPTVLAANTPALYDVLYDRVEDHFSSTTEDGPGILRIIRPSGVERRILGVYQSGLDSGGGDDWLWNLCPIQLLCPDGYFGDPNVTHVNRRYSAGGAPFLGAGYPRTSSAKVLGNTEVTNAGQVTAWPVWVIDGPFSAFTARFLNADGTDGPVYLTVTPASPLVGGERRIVDCTPGATSVTDGDGASMFGELLLPGSTLFGFPRGTSKIRFTATGAGVGTEVDVSFVQRFKKA